MRSGEEIVQSPWVEFNVEINVQTNHIDGLARGLIESAVARVNNDAVAANVELMSAGERRFPVKDVLSHWKYEWSSRKDLLKHGKSEVRNVPPKKLRVFQIHRLAITFH